MAQAVSRRSPTAKARVRSRLSPCGICGGQSSTGIGFFPRVFRFSPVSFIPPVLHYTEKWKKSSLSQGCVISLSDRFVVRILMHITQMYVLTKHKYNVYLKNKIYFTHLCILKIYVYIYILINLIFLTLICSRPGIHHARSPTI
jgi:hypothetical protein